jgi:hypothetical protein
MQDDHITKSDLHIQCNSHQNISAILDLEKTILKFIWKHKRSQIAKASLSKNSNIRDITIPNFKLYLKSHSNKNRRVLAQKQA